MPIGERPALPIHGWAHRLLAGPAEDDGSGHGRDQSHLMPQDHSVVVEEELPAQIIDQDSHHRPHQVTQKEILGGTCFPTSMSTLLFAEDTLSYPYACQVLLTQVVLFFFLAA